MLTIVANTENPNTIAIPPEEMEKLGVKNGDEVEIYKENDEIIMRSIAEVERKRRLEQAKEKVFEEWHDVFVALAKGADNETEDNNPESEAEGNFILTETEPGKYKFILTARGGKTIFESKIFESQEEARREIESVKKEISEIKEKILDLPVKS